MHETGRGRLRHPGHESQPKRARIGKKNTLPVKSNSVKKCRSWLIQLRKRAQILKGMLENFVLQKVQINMYAMQDRGIQAESNHHPLKEPILI